MLNEPLPGTAEGEGLVGPRPHHFFARPPQSNTMILFLSSISKRSGKKQADNNFYKNNDTFETKFTRHVSVVQRPSPVESRINFKLR